MKLAGYIRVSTEGQVDAFGKDVQADGIKRWATLNGYVITEWFQEDAVSGKIEGGERPKMAEIVARAKEFDGIVAFDPTRYARRLIVQETLYGLLWDSGLRIFASTMGEVEKDDDPTRILVRQILGVIAEFDHRTTVRKLQSGRKAKINAGGYAGGIPVYGMQVIGAGKTAQFVPHEVESQVIELIGKLHQEGNSLRSIAGSLNGRGVRTKTGKSWSAPQVQRIIKRNENA